ncbi:5-oxoprolinase subunit B family protein [Curtobacterium herbarum]|uniref:Allophanate hydrolase subunit 1 n=1 Tax=Curtobacterium herbarum TaxID=150122 RepID=A0ABN1ZFX5_9MICO|nr:allophanate hydrolase subunit 1 [Curtobacterium herbarum]MBM7474390.1 KipI family sensor histidine kinase inhibitor [Curtobacterium herbarum]MCS6545776.1 allophanate hydrolase subunit 1 [Curtobacterium herbarum]
MSLDLRSAGTSAVLATFDSLAEVVAFRAGLAGTGTDAATGAGVTEVVSGARTLLFRFDPDVTDAGRVRSLLSEVRPSRPADDDGQQRAPVVVPVTYDGADLDAVGALTGMSRDDLVGWHTGQVWTSAFCGFAPGFSYLTGTAPSLDLPRRDTSRTAVPSGAVALAGEFSAVYPRTSPGGWQLIGRTDVPMWSLDRTPPALAPAGVRLRFVDAEAPS